MPAQLATRLILALGLAFSGAVSSATLSDVYRDALGYDAQYASARASYRAVQEKLPQARAGLLPNVSADAYLRRNDVKSTLPGGDARFTSDGMSASAAQPLFRWQNWVQYEQAKLQLSIGERQLKLA